MTIVASMAVGDDEEFDMKGGFGATRKPAHKRSLSKVYVARFSGILGLVVVLLFAGPGASMAVVEEKSGSEKASSSAETGAAKPRGVKEDGAVEGDSKTMKGDSTTPKNKPTSKEPTKDETAFSTTLDYGAKHVSLTTGVVVLNPFSIEDGPTPSSKVLDDDDIGANAIIEAGFRRRWAWDSWESEDLAKARMELETLKQQRKVLESKVEESAKVEAVATVAASDGKKVSGPTEAEKTLAKTRAEELEKLNAVIEEKIKALAKAEAGATTVNKTDAFFRELIGPEDSLPLSDEKAGAHPTKRFLANTFGMLAPTNFTVRLGFALGEDADSNAASVAGSGDFYTEVGVGWDVFRGYLRARDVPLKVSFGPEVHTSFNGDGGRDSFRQRILTGAAMSVGAPVGSDDGRIVEVVVRVGWVRVDAPQFLNSADRTLLVRNEKAEFRKEQGVGLDVEFNIPITKTLGYVFLRAATNHNINPDPWATTIGWTIPINNLGSMFAGGE